MVDKYPRISISFVSGERAELNPLENTFILLQNSNYGGREGYGGWDMEEIGTEGQSIGSLRKVTEGRSAFTLIFSILLLKHGCMV